MVVPFPAGGATDTGGRIVAERMRFSLGQPVIVENAPGGNGVIGVNRVAHAAPDGYTLVAGIWNTHVANGALYSLPYDLQNDFVPISLIAGGPYLIATKKVLSANNLTDFIAWLKRNPNTATAGTIGVGSPQHVGGVFFQNLTGTRFQFIPYRGGAPAMQDLVAAHIDWMLAFASDGIAQLRLGNIKAFAVTAKTRLASAPDVPTVDEAGLREFYLSNWIAVWAPRTTPTNIVTRLNAAVMDALADLQVQARFADLGFEVFPRNLQTPQALGDFQKAEIEKWWPIIKAANIKGE